MAAVYNEAIAAAASDGMIEPEELAECVVEELRKESVLIFASRDRVGIYAQQNDSLRSLDWRYK
jgi:hypothetical protein